MTGVQTCALPIWFGLLGSLLVGAGCCFLVLGVLRLVQTEFADVMAGRWMSLVPYAVALVVSLVVAALALSRVNTTPLQRDAAARKESR